MIGKGIGVGHWQQPERLHNLITKAGLRHGQEAVVTLPQVGFFPAGPGESAEQETPLHQRAQGLFFCEVPEIRDIQLLTAGDDEDDIPRNAYIDPNLPFPDDHGCFDLAGVKISTNGAIIISATDQTRFIPATEELETVFAAT